MKVLRSDMSFVGDAIERVNKLRKFKASVAEREVVPKEKSFKKLRQFLRK